MGDYAGGGGGGVKRDGGSIEEPFKMWLHNNNFGFFLL